MDFLLSKYGLIFTEFDSIDRGGAFSYALLWCVVYSSQSSRYFGALPIFTRKADAKDFAVLVFTGMLISSEYDVTIYGHVTVLRQLLLVKNTDYIIIVLIEILSYDVIVVRSTVTPRSYL